MFVGEMSLQADQFFPIFFLVKMIFLPETELICAIYAGNIIGKVKKKEEDEKEEKVNKD